MGWISERGAGPKDITANSLILSFHKRFQLFCVMVQIGMIKIQVTRDGTALLILRTTALFTFII